MSRSLAGFVIDTLEFARDARSAEGVVPVSVLPRLQEQVASADAVLECSLSGYRESGRNWLKLTVRGSLELVCQRCLGAMPYAFDLVADLQVVAEGEAWPDEALEDGALALEVDAIAADEALLVTDLIEEEVLLALPIAPRHEAACTAPATGKDKSASPFAVLAQLKNKQ